MQKRNESYCNTVILGPVIEVQQSCFVVAVFRSAPGDGEFDGNLESLMAMSLERRQKFLTKVMSVKSDCFRINYQSLFSQK